MHNCIKTKEQILELLLDGADQPGDSLSTELHACRECSAEFDSLSATLRVTSRLKEMAAPPESYWSSYHAGLRAKLMEGQRRGGHGGPPLQSTLQGFLKSSIRVPVPVAAVAVIVFVLLFSLSFRKSEPIQNPSVVHVPVEVPVIKEKVQEKIVTRVVYKETRSLSKKPTRAGGNPPVESTFAKSKTTAPALNGFKPVDDVKLVVLKGGSVYK